MNDARWQQEFYTTENIGSRRIRDQNDAFEGTSKRLLERVGTFQRKRRSEGLKG
jgi:hypothetical protein